MADEIKIDEKVVNIPTGTTKISKPTSKFIEVSGREVEIKKLGLLSYTHLMNSMRELIASITELVITDWGSLLTGFEAGQDEAEPSDFTDPNIVRMQSTRLADTLIDMLTKDIDQLIEFLSLCVPSLDRKFIEEEVGLPDVFVILETVLDVNGIMTFVGDVKNLMGGTLNRQK